MLRRYFFLTLLLLVAGCLPGWAQTPATVTLLHFNDVYEITPVGGGKAGGLARVARLRAELAGKNGPVLTTLGGDYLSPSAIGSAKVDGERLHGRQMVAVLNVLGLDWATLGNHEFDVPEAVFRQRLIESKFKVVTSNVTDANGQPFPGTVPYAVVPMQSGKRSLRIGLFGVTLDANKVPWAKYADPIAAARQSVTALQAQGCDAIVALTHLSLTGDQQLAEAVPAIDVILGGHEHENWELRRGPNLTPIIKADANVRSVAIVTLQFGKTSTRPTVSSRLQAITDALPEGPKTAAEVQKWMNLAIGGFQQLGFAPTAVVATTSVALDGRESVVRNDSTRLTRLIADATFHEGQTGGAVVDAAVYNSGSIRIDDVLPPGPVTQYDIIRVLPFGGKILRATVKGALLQQLFDAGEASRGSGGYLQWRGLTRTATGPQIGGQPIDPNRSYTIAVNDFLLSGRESNMGFFKREAPDVSNVVELRDVRLAVIDELQRQFPGK